METGVSFYYTGGGGGRQNEEISHVEELGFHKKMLLKLESPLWKSQNKNFSALSGN
jgi:hypothetical protein